MIRSIETHDKSLLVEMNLFKNVSPEFIEVYLDKCEYGTLLAGEVLLSPHKKNNHIFLLFSGRLTVHLDSVEDPPLAAIEPHECVGEISIIDNKAPTAYVVAAEESRVLIIDQEILWSLVKASPEVARNLMFIWSRRVREGNIALNDSTELLSYFQQSSVFDALTGMYNRLWLNEMFQRILKRCMMSNKPLSLVMLSVDRFKDFIFQHGCLAGDLALCAVAGTLRRYMRSSDMVARFSSDQFALILPETKLARAFSIAKRLKREIAKTKINVEGRFNLSAVTASFGVAEMNSRNSIESLLVDASTALARASDQGGNCVSQ